MRRLLLGALVGMLSFSAFADVASDLQAGQPMATIFENAQQTGTSIESILGSVIAADRDFGPEAVCVAVTLDPDNAVELAEFAIASGLLAPLVATSAMQCAPEQATEVFSRMLQLGVPEDELLASALEAGQDPTALLEATAAGPQGEGQGLTTPPGQNVSLTPIDTNAGGGGGNIIAPASPG